MAFRARTDYDRAMGLPERSEARRRRMVAHRAVDHDDADANWIDLDSLLALKSAIDKPRHQEDAPVLREVKKLR